MMRAEGLLPVSPVSPARPAPVPPIPIPPPALRTIYGTSVTTCPFLAMVRIQPAIWDCCLHLTLTPIDPVNLCQSGSCKRRGSDDIRFGVGRGTYIRMFGERLDNPVDRHLEQGRGTSVASKAFGSVNRIRV